MNRIATFFDRTSAILRKPQTGLGVGFTLSALAGAPMPLPQLAILGPFAASVAGGALGGRAAAAVGFASYMVFARPEPAQTIVAGALSVAVGWIAPELVAYVRSVKDGRAEQERASAIMIDCDGFSALDATYGEGASDHVFRMLHRALKTETRDEDLVVHTQGHELILVLDGAPPEVAQRVMARVEKRFSLWLQDAGYECNLTVGLSNGAEDEDVFDGLLRATHRRDGEPYLD